MVEWMLASDDDIECKFQCCIEERRLKKIFSAFLVRTDIKYRIFKDNKQNIKNILNVFFFNALLHLEMFRRKIFKNKYK